LRIGVFGGTFDPPHLGHQILAVEALDQAGLDRVLWVLTPDPPHKQGMQISPVNHRLTMTQMMVDCHPKFGLSDIEFKRPGPHYALDTMLVLHEQNPGDELYYIIGGDSLRDLPTWHKPVEFISACDQIIVMQRPGFRPDLSFLYQNYPEIKKRLNFLDVPLIEISGKNIRQRAKVGRAFWQFVIPSVYEYIATHDLYV
jgi:nicotinate-nucleotide adenylyltransferase